MVVHRGVALVLAGACATACLAAAGCSSSGSSNGSSDPLGGMSAKQVLNKAVADLKAAPSFKISGNISQTNGAYSLHLGYLRDKGCEGMVAQQGKGSIAMIVIGDKAWVKPDDMFIKSVAGSQASVVIAQIGGKYLSGSTSNSNVASLTGLCNVNTLSSQLLQPTSVVKGKVVTRNGQQALPLTDTSKGGTLYVTDTATPQVLEIVNTTAGKSGTITFNVGAPVTLSAPPASQTLDGSQFGF